MCNLSVSALRKYFPHLSAFNSFCGSLTIKNGPHWAMLFFFHTKQKQRG